MRFHTVGHSTRAFDELVAALRSFGIRLLIDVRTIPRSRHTPQFNRDVLARRLPRRRIRYRHLAALGGLRKPRPDSTNGAWRNASFRGFADYMETPAFATGLAELRALAREHGPAAFMCAEAVPWRCHRSLIADALVASGDEVLHIMAAGKAPPHALTPFARVEAGRVSYPAAEASLFDDVPGTGAPEGGSHGPNRTVLHARDRARASAPRPRALPRRGRRRGVEPD